MQKKYLISGLGNIGETYKNTRHNIGFKIVEKLAEKLNVPFKKKDKLKGLIAEGNLNDHKIYLLKPTTYMNESGQAVLAVKKFYKIDLENILIVVDDLTIDFGEFRLKKDSGTGGHNGLRSIEESLHSDEYARLRIGIGFENKNNMKNFVLSNFSKEEKDSLDRIIVSATDFIEMWMKEGIEKTMNISNIRAKKLKNFKEDLNDETK